MGRLSLLIAQCLGGLLTTAGSHGMCKMGDPGCGSSSDRALQESFNESEDRALQEGGGHFSGGMSVLSLYERVERERMLLQEESALLNAEIYNLSLVQNQVVDMRDALAAETELAEERGTALNTLWMIFASSWVMFMQLGFALVESGSVREKSYRHVFFKNVLDFVLGATLWYSIGYWIAFPDLYVGDVWDLGRFDLLIDPGQSQAFCFQCVFASTAVTIVSGSMAERTRMEAYLAFVILCSGMVYSVVVRWTWGGGWLSQPILGTYPPYHDFAGSGVVHACGGVAAMVGAWLVGPRVGRFDPDGTESEMDKYKPRSLNSIVVGTLILWFGWFGFNPGSTTSLLDGSADVASLAFTNTLIAPAASATTVLILGILNHEYSTASEFEKRPQFDLGGVCNGCLAGLVAITAGCDSIPVAWSPFVGLVAGFLYRFWSGFMVWLQIDDPVDAVAVHGACGILGVIIVGFLDREGGLFTTGSADLLVSQCIGIGSIAGYVAGTAGVYFYIVKAYGVLRLNIATEVMGVDFVEFGDGDHRDVSDIEFNALAKYRQKLLDRLGGDIWGIEVEGALLFSKLHRRVTVGFLSFAICYNYFYYVYFEWRDWTFFSLVNMIVGTQSASAAHAEFICRPGDPAIRYCCLLVLALSLLLSILNFLLAEDADLTAAWLRTMTLAFSWSIWMHLRVQSVDWESVCFGSEVNKHSMLYLRVLLGVAKASTRLEYFLDFITTGRMQHIGECTFVFAGVSSGLWAAMDEFMNKSQIIGVMLMFFSAIQIVGMVIKVLVATSLRSLKLVRILTGITFASGVPVMVIVYLTSESSMKLVTVGLAAVGLLQQLFVLVLWTAYSGWRKRKEARALIEPQTESIPSPRMEPPDLAAFAKMKTPPDMTPTTKLKQENREKARNDALMAVLEQTDVVRGRNARPPRTSLRHDVILPQKPLDWHKDAALSISSVASSVSAPRLPSGPPMRKPFKKSGKKQKDSKSTSGKTGTNGTPASVDPSTIGASA